MDKLPKNVTNTKTPIDLFLKPVLPLLSGR